MQRLRSAHSHAYNHNLDSILELRRSNDGTPREAPRRERELELEHGIRMELPQSSKGSRERSRDPKKYVYPNPSNPKIRPPLPSGPYLPRINQIAAKDQSQLDYIRYNNKENLMHYRKPQHIGNYHHHEELYGGRMGSVDYGRNNNINRLGSHHDRPPLPANNPYLANILAPQNN